MEHFDPPKKCLICDMNLITLEDYIGGGSHYWLLECEKCKQKHVFDTYRFKLELYSKESEALNAGVV